MAKDKETENKSDNKEQKIVKKSSYSKKKKVKKNIPSGIAYVSLVLTTQLFQLLILREILCMIYGNKTVTRGSPLGNYKCSPP